MSGLPMKILARNIDCVGKPKKLENNTIQYTRPDGATVIRLHASDIIVKHANGECELASGGYRTVTTRDRLRKYGPKSVNLIQRKGVWYLENETQCIPFEEGVRIAADGTLPDVPISVAEKQSALHKRINKFVRLLDGFEALPLPGPGDCWGCYLRDQNGRTMGEDDPSHLESHIDEKYVHGSLLYNAMKFTGYRDAAIGYMLQTKGDGLRQIVKRALRKYLKAKLERTAQ